MADDTLCSLISEVSADHIENGRFRHGSSLNLWGDDKPAACTVDQIAGEGFPLVHKASDVAGRPIRTMLRKGGGLRRGETAYNGGLSGLTCRGSAFAVVNP